MGSALLCVLGPAASPGWSLQPALGMRCSRPRGPGVGTCWGHGHQPNASGRCRALGAPLDGEGALPWAPVGPTPVWLHTGEGGMLHLGSLGERPDRQPRLCRRGQPGLGCPCRLGAGDAARVTPRRGRAAGGAPAPHLPADGKSRLAVAPGQRRARPAGFGGVRQQHMIRAAGPRAEVSQSHPGAALTSPRAGAAPHVSRSPKAALTRRSGPVVRPLRYRGAGIAPIARDGSPEPLLALVPASLVPLPLGPKGRH